MAYPFPYPYPYQQFFYAHGVTVPPVTPNPHPHPHPYPYPHLQPTPLLQPQPHPHPLPYTLPLTPSINHTQHNTNNDSGYFTPGIDFNTSHRSRASSSSAASTSGSSSRPSGSNLSFLSKGASSPPQPGGGYLPLLSSTPSAPVPAYTAALPHPFYTSTPYYSHHKFGLPHKRRRTGDGSEVPHVFHMTPPAPQMDPTMLQHMAYMGSLPGYHHPYPVPFLQRNGSSSAQRVQLQAAPLDLSASEDLSASGDQSTPKLIRKKLFPVNHAARSNNLFVCEPSTSAQSSQREDRDRRNPFGINKILGVKSSPAKARVEFEPFEEAAFLPQSPPRAGPSRKRPLSDDEDEEDDGEIDDVNENNYNNVNNENDHNRNVNAEHGNNNQIENNQIGNNQIENNQNGNNQNGNVNAENGNNQNGNVNAENGNNQNGNANENPEQEKKRREKPPLWGHEIDELLAEFDDCPEKEIYCDEEGFYQVPKIPEDHDAQREMKASLLRLFAKSNLPPVPNSLKNNIFGLRFYPGMQTIFQASLYKDSRDLKVSEGGLAFENYLPIETNAQIDSLMEKRGEVFHCMARRNREPPAFNCTFTASSLGKMRRHIKNHLPNKKWVCAFCRTQMTDQTDMGRHGTTHTKLRPFPCDSCDKIFSQKITMLTHGVRFHGKKLVKELLHHSYTCRPCGVHYGAYEREKCIWHLKTYHFDNLYHRLKKRKKYPFFLPSEKV